MSKLRKALLEASISLSWATHGHLTEDDAKGCLAVVDAALAEPVLNCEVGTPEEQYERWRSNCGHGIPRCFSGCKVYKRATELGLLDEKKRVKCDCKFVWAQMPYEREVTK